VTVKFWYIVTRLPWGLVVLLVVADRLAEVPPLALELDE
jgi:hypothetical protein